MRKPSPDDGAVTFDDSEESELSISEDEEGIERELADVTFEELQKARSDGSYSVYGKLNEEKKAKRADKNRPTEASWKKPAGRFREVTRLLTRFKMRYGFLYENEPPAERMELQKQLKKSNDQDVIDELKSRIAWIDKQLKSERGKQTEAAILAEHKKKEREAAMKGKRPFYLKKSEIRRRRLIEKYNSLKASGKVEAFIEKKRRKNAAKEHRYVPYRRSGNTPQES